MPGSGLCANVPVGLHIEFLHSLSGPITNPQAQLVGAQYSYITQDVQFKVVKANTINITFTRINYLVCWAFVFV